MVSRAIAEERLQDLIYSYRLYVLDCRKGEQWKYQHERIKEMRGAIKALLWYHDKIPSLGLGEPLSDELLGIEKDLCLCEWCGKKEVKGMVKAPSGEIYAVCEECKIGFDISAEEKKKGR